MTKMGTKESEWRDRASELATAIARGIVARVSCGEAAFFEAGERATELAMIGALLRRAARARAELASTELT